MKRVSGFSKMDEAARNRMAALSELKDEAIDLSDAPEWTADDFKKAVPFRSIWKPRKEQITARLDVDVLLWLKSHGKGYQTLMNELLRKEMLEEQKRMA
jgi:uncharacterized protein (DUF4415 family)